MPTPFTHLALAREMLGLTDQAADEAGPARLPAEVSAALAAELPAFVFGNIAPDAQTVSGQEREATHFFPVPLDGAPPAPERLVGMHPALGRPQRLPPARAAFLAGYIAHLALDQMWVEEVFEPGFGPRQTWSTFVERLYLHNALRAFWDVADLRRLSPGLAGTLREAEPQGWVPFLADEALQRWRDLVADQLQPGASRTIEVFAERMGADPGAFARLVRSASAMQEQVFGPSGISPERLARLRRRGAARCVDWIVAYWAGRLARAD